MNKVFLIGRLTNNPELRYTSNGVATCQFAIALDKGKDKNGNDKGADFPIVVVWEKQAENLCKYMRKGSQIAVEGKLSTRSYDDKEGKKIYVTEVTAISIQFLDSKKDENNMSSDIDYTNTTILTEQIDNKPFENDPFADFEETVEDNGLPFY